MKIFEQATFESPTALETVQDEPLVIHRRSGSPENSHLAIFVHGLGGTRYGKNSTWGLLPNYLFADFPQLDIGMYSFRSAWRRLRFWRSIPVLREAEVLADVLRSLRRDEEYGAFILIGHSLGGLLCKGAAVVLSENKQQQALKSVSDLLLIATPQLGSLRVPSILQWATADAKVLRAHSDFIQRVMNVFQARFHCLLDPPTDSKYHVRAWAVIAAADVWVDALSAGNRHT